MKKLALILSKIAYFIAAVFLGYLAYNTTHYTFTHDITDYSAAYLYECPDSRLKNLLAIIIIGALFIGLCKLFFIGCKNDKSKDRRVLIFSISASLLMFVLLCLWVSKTHIRPFWDQAVTVQAAQSFNKGDFSFIHTDLYLTMYPQQLGLIFFESLFLRIWDNYQIFQYMNAFFIAVIIFMSGRLAKALSDKAEVSFLTTLATALCAPLFYYVSYVYGDIFSIAATLFVGWAVIKYLKTGKIIYSVPALVISMIMLPVRQNTIIFIITVVILLIVISIKNKSLRPALFAVALFVMPMLVNTGIKAYYENRADYKFDNEIPSINWIVMGMRGDLEDGIGVGYYDGYNYYMWTVLGNSKEATTEYSKEQLANYLQSYKENPGHCYEFFRYKLLEQWLEPTFDCIYMTVSDNTGSWEEVDLLYNENCVKGLHTYMNYFLAVAYFFAFVYAVYALFADKECYDLLIAVFFVGVFLFSIIWEAKGRYTFPGFMFVLIFTGAGICKLKEVIVLLYNKFIKRK